MRAFAFSTILAAVALARALPLQRREVTLDVAATLEAQQRDDTATRALTATTIKTSSGKCLSVDPLSGDFRENLTPVTFADCDGSANQQWDVITSGKHQDTPGQANIVSTLTNACLNFDPRRAAGNQVLLFSCGGRADGGGAVTNSQQFAFTSAQGAQALVPGNGEGKVCLTSKSGNALDQTACDPANPSDDELFTFGGNGTPAAGANNANLGKTSTSAAPPAATTSAAAGNNAAAAPTATVTVTVTASGAACTA